MCDKIFLSASQQNRGKTSDRAKNVTNSQVQDMETLRTTDWLMCVCRADMGNVIVAFISYNRLPSYFKKAIQGHFMLLKVRVAVTCQR